MTPAGEQLLHSLAALERLNPDAAEMARPELLALAAACGADEFAPVAAFAEELIRRYQTSPWKQAEQNVIRDFIGFLERATLQLEAGGELAAVPGPSETDAPPSVALVHRRPFSSLDWCRVQTRAGIPKATLLAVDAARNRNRLLGSVLEPMLAVLHRLDAARAVAWEVSFLERHQGKVDADVVRDVLTAWYEEPLLSRDALEWTLRWSADENLARQWPHVVDKADLVLRRHALPKWAAQSPGGLVAIRHLQRIVAAGDVDADTIERWVTSSINAIGESIHFFLACSDVLMHRPEDAPEAWRQPALFREVETVAMLYLPVLVLADVALRIPGGAYRFALAFFGLGRTGEEQWRQRLQLQAEKNIRRMFLIGLRTQTPPEDIIRRLCFGDDELHGKLRLRLDLGTRQFDSMRVRDEVIGRLAAHYVSRRESALLAVEVARRYRALMRILHEDNLARLLTPEQMQRVGEMPVFREVMAIAADARRFLARRRDMQLSLEEMVAAEMDFARDLRARRRPLLRRLVFSA